MSQRLPGRAPTCSWWNKGLRHIGSAQRGDTLIRQRLARCWCRHYNKFIYGSAPTNPSTLHDPTAHYCSAPPPSSFCTRLIASQSSWMEQFRHAEGTVGAWCGNPSSCQALANRRLDAYCVVLLLQPMYHVWCTQTIWGNIFEMHSTVTQSACRV